MHAGKGQKIDLNFLKCKQLLNGNDVYPLGIDFLFCFQDQLDSPLRDGEHVYLCANNKQRFMKAIYVQREPGQTIHNKSLEDGCGKFQIVEIFHENIQYWQDFDPDVHCPDTYIMWKLSCVEQKTDHPSKT